MPSLAVHLACKGKKLALAVVCSVLCAGAWQAPVAAADKVVLETNAKLAQLANQEDNKFKLQELLETMPQVSANFKQELSDKDDNLISESRGKLYFKRPNLFMMHTLIPDETALFTRGNDIYFYDSAVNQVTILKMKSVESNPIMLIIMDDPSRWDKYYVARDRDRFTLIPKQKEDFKSITISFIDHRMEDSSSYIKAIDSISMRMDDGNTNFYLFANQKDSVCNKDFVYDLPSDVEIDDQR